MSMPHQPDHPFPASTSRWHAADTGGYLTPPPQPDTTWEADPGAADREVESAVQHEVPDEGLEFDLDADEGVDPPPDLPSTRIKIAGRVYTAFAPQDTTLYHTQDEDASEYTRAERIRRSMFGAGVYDELVRRELDPNDPMRAAHIANAMEKLFAQFRPYFQQVANEVGGGGSSDR